MALTQAQARELRSLMQTWNKSSREVGDMLGGSAVTAGGLQMNRLRAAMDRRSQAEQLVIAFWSRTS